MSFLARIKSAPRTVPAMIVPAKRGLTGLVVDKGIRYGGAFGLGVAKGYYRERFHIGGKPADAVIGGIGLGLGAILEIWSGGNSKFAGYLNAAGDTALQSYLNSMGTAFGTKKAGRKVYISAPGVNPQLPPGLQQTDVLGAQDGLGAYLSEQDILRHSSQK